MISPIEGESIERVASEHLQIYSEALKSWVRNALLL